MQKGTTMYRKKNLDMTLYRGLSTDTKPDADFGSVFHEMDTGDIYRTDGHEWHQCGSLTGTDPSIYMSRWVRGNTKKAWELSALAGNAGGGDLPDGYERINGIALEKARYVIEDFYLTGADTVRLSAKGTTGNWFGCFNATSATNNYSFYATTTASGKYLRYNGSSYSSYVIGNQRYNIVITPTGMSGLESDSTYTQKSFTCSIPFCIGTTSPSGTAAASVEFYGNIVVDGRLRLVPCRRVSDGTIGWYDGTTFYEPRVESSGSVTAL